MTLLVSLRKLCSAAQKSKLKSYSWYLCNPLFFRKELAKFTTDSNIHSYVGMTNIEVYGGYAYEGTVCGYMSWRTAVVMSYSDAITGEVLDYFVCNY